MSFALFDIKNVQGMGNYRPNPATMEFIQGTEKILIRRIYFEKSLVKQSKFWLIIALVLCLKISMVEAFT